MRAPRVAEPVTGTDAEATVAALAQPCRNCGANAAGNYCANCGQETSLALPSAPRFLREAAGRYIAFDGRFWRTMHRLVFRPGVLTVDYLAGRRRRYVRPGRLFVALSIGMFAVLRLSVTTPEIVATQAPGAKPGSLAVVEGDVDILGAVPSSAVLAPIRSRLQAFDRLRRVHRLRAPV